MSGLSDTVRGTANKTIGKVPGNKKAAAKGELQETKGNLTDGIASAGASVSRKIDQTAAKLNGRTQ
jgi:uncharacterized protein YjbJ (UPF0337 family)